MDTCAAAVTNATAFSPADTFRLTVRAKLLMMAKAGISFPTIVLVASREVGILNRMNTTARTSTKVRIASRSEISALPHWLTSFANERKDHRYHELVEDTLRNGFNYGYLVVEDDQIVRAIQPYFVVDQDLLAGESVGFKTVLTRIRRLWPRFMHARTLMVGSAAGEGHLDGDDATQFATADALGRSLPDLASKLNCALIVLKEFPTRYRAPLHCLHGAGFARVPSMPMTTLNIDYKNFEDYLAHSLSPRTRGKVRRKLRAAERAEQVNGVERVAQMPFGIVIEAAAVEPFVTVGDGPLDDVVKDAIVKVELERDGIIEAHIFVADAVALHGTQAERDDMAALTPYEKADLVRDPASDLAQEFSRELFELKRRAFEYFFIKRVEVVDVGRCVGNDDHGDRGRTCGIPPIQSMQSSSGCFC